MEKENESRPAAALELGTSKPSGRIIYDLEIKKEDEQVAVHGPYGDSLLLTSPSRKSKRTARVSF
jgi:hypothetical protein